jgi:hypothetical protein
MGELDWTGIFSALADIGYDGITAIENEDPLAPGLAGVGWAGEFLRSKMLPSQRTESKTAERKDYGWGDLLDPITSDEEQP